MVSESEFRALADAELKAMSQKLDAFTELTVDYANEILTIEFDDGDKFVVNQQGPTRQIWFAASFAAAHFELVDGRWKDTKSSDELRARVSRDISKKLGKSVAL